MDFCNYIKNIILVYELRILSANISEEYSMKKSDNDIHIFHGTLEYYLSHQYVWYVGGAVRFLYDGSKARIYWQRQGKE